MLLNMGGRRGQLSSKHFLYDRKGPWPQPSPTEPLGTSAEVVHLPWQEQLDWQWHIGLRYFRDLLIWGPISCLRTLGFRSLPEIDDGAMADVLVRGIYSRFLSPLDPVDVDTFRGKYDPNDGATYYKLDFTPIESVDPYSGMFVASTVTLVRRPDPEKDAITLVAIAVGKDRLVLVPGDGDAWQLAKYFILQGCSYGTLFTGHPNVHFPYDSINAITKSSIPTHHLIFKLLIPHLRFSLVLDNAVLQSKGSVISNVRSTIYDPFTAKADAGLMAFFVAGHNGLKGNSAYPRYLYPSKRDDFRLPPTRYGQFMREYFEPFHELATAVVAEMSDEELSYAEEWSRWIQTWIETFPRLHFRHAPEKREESKRQLVFALAVALWDVSVVHSTDHQDFAANVPVEYKCFRLRRAPPAATKIDPLDRKTLNRRVDIFKSTLAHRMFFAPTTVTRLVDVDYRFESNTLRAAQTAFKERLRAVDEGLAAKGIPRYMALGDMAASIQY